ncbi:MAG: glycosyltransferase, partial [Candidatus Margulisbacteria bacterium]|nr:glycosyltransferase [Candidatus Margulisiibacteriota bacterium]
FVWRYRDYVKRESFPWIIKLLLPLFLFPIRMWDLATAKRVDHFVAISETVAARIKQHYGRESDIIYPPVNCDYFLPSAVDGDYFLEVVRLNPYKRIDLVVEAFNRLGSRLRIVGDGPDRARLQKMAKANVEFTGKISDEELLSVVAQCRALIFPGEEDWGLAPLEAMSCGRPVIAFRGGSAVEFVKEPETGCFFNESTVESLMQTVNKFAGYKYDKNAVRDHALTYDRSKFRGQIKLYIEEKQKSAKL